MSNHSIVVVGATPGGIAAAVRAAREGHRTLLVTYNDHLGGMMAGGLSYTDTLTKKARTPILGEFVEAVLDHYGSTYGPESDQVEFCEDGYIFEPHVAKETFTALVAAEDDLDVQWGYHPTTVGRSGGEIEDVTFEPFDGGSQITIGAEVFVEATYQGDLAATAGVPCRIGRESRSEYDEQFAGRLFTQLRGDRYYPRAAVGDVDDSVPPDRRGPLDIPVGKQQGDLDLIPHPAGLTEIFPGSTGRGDDTIQAYNYRLCLSREPDNRRLPDEPANYDREDYFEALDDVIERGLRSHLRLRYLPNEKADMNAADLPGENYEYPTGDWKTRESVARQHREHALGLLYFLQNDDSVPDDIQSDAREWGLAIDEFTDNDNFPWQLYIREARRIRGRYTFAEADARHAPGLDRTPVHDDAIAVAEYPLDSHACSTERQAGSQPEGFFYASQVTRPSQVPYRSLLARDIRNLIVPVPLSSTHVGYGTIRLEPTWMHIGEAAGMAAARAVETDRALDALDTGELQRALVERGTMLSFFNEFDMGADEPWVEAVQYLGTKGFFATYDADPDEALDEATAGVWAETAGAALRGSIDPTDRARRLPDVREEPISAGSFVDHLREEIPDEPVDPGMVALDADDTIRRGDACRLVYQLLSDAR